MSVLALIAKRAFNTDILVSAVETNPYIGEYLSYNYDAYRPMADVYWDGDVPEQERWHRNAAR